MPGQPIPPIIIEAFATNAPTCTAAAPVLGGKTSPFPAGSQEGITNGAASLADGFPAITMQNPTVGGVPPFGVDFNGLLYLITAQIAAMGAGQQPAYSAPLATAMGGYALGALLGKANGSGFWINLVAGNSTNPDTGGSNWLDWSPVGSDYMSANLASGTTDNFTPTGFNASIGFIDINPAGNASIGSLPAGVNGQTVTVTNIASGSITLTLLSLDSSATQPKFRCPSPGLELLANQSTTVRYSTGVSLWLVVS
jgi:hypothetical protein